MMFIIRSSVCLLSILFLSLVQAAPKYDYGDVLGKSILFYEAQRSGKLPATNRVHWRADSALNDKGLNGEDLTGGWYDAGDNIKFGYPMANVVTMLNWGLLRYKDAYQDSGQLDHMYDCVRWGLTWLVKCHTAPNELYIMVGDPTDDHRHWNRPENMTTKRTPKKIDAAHPGSDAASEYAAAMASGYLVFKTKDPDFAAELLQHAKQLSSFAKNHRGSYSKTLTSDFNLYNSADESDEMPWGMAWLYKATNESSYLQDAKSMYQGGTAWAQSWDNKLLGTSVRDDTYKTDIESSMTEWLPGRSVPYSPHGLAVRTKWGSLRYASNMAFMALLAADDGIQTDKYRKWAMSQINYALGDTGRSYVVGFGTNPPTHPHHRAASCPDMQTPCDFSWYSKPSPNPHVLTGALVGGPGLNEAYTDRRSDYIQNEVAVDYNAGFQSAVAGTY
ncbi:hypothetical protein FSP39_025314 [Pinctada imbricata]|uniref:Endoglucanase n=1 Tax=Pinctada imbricata TaxID=66713 RepID=A0AA89C8S1_PINIB|nr:hypothetical protein FSP39_025314 [Pinctada imbricata]